MCLRCVRVLRRDAHHKPYTHFHLPFIVYIFSSISPLFFRPKFCSMSCDRQPNSVGDAQQQQQSCIERKGEGKQNKKSGEMFVVRLSLPLSNNKLEVRFYIQRDAVFSFTSLLLSCRLSCAC